MEVTSVKRIHQADWTDSGVRFFRARDIVSSMNNEEIDNPVFISKDKYEEYSRVSGKVIEGDLLVTGVGTIGVPYLIKDTTPLYFKDGNIIWFKNNNTLNGSYFYYCFQNSYIQNQIYSASGKGTVGTYTIENGKKTSIRYPSLKEQMKIGNLLDTMTTMITLHQRKLEKLKLAKKALLQKLFPKNGSQFPEIRFKGFTDAWEQRKLGEVVKSYSGGTPTASNKEYYGGDIPFIRSAEINSDTTELYITQKGLDNSSAKIVEKGTILYAMYGATSGEVGISKINGAINQAILAMIPLNYDGKIIAQYLRKNKESIIGKYLQGGQGNLSANIILELPIQLPGLEESNQIAYFLESVDNIITLHQRKLDKLQEVKKGLLQKMFV